MPNVFADFHHAGLLNSLIMLFENRLDYNLYRPIGVDWQEKGYWKVYDHPATIQQYLGINAATPDGTPPVNQIADESFTMEGKRDALKGVYHCHDIDSGRTNKAITFDAFMGMPFAYVIASIPAHVEPFRKLCDLHPSHPKLIYQIGNAWNITVPQSELVDGIMASAKIENGYPISIGKPLVQYHQEFDLDEFRYEEPEGRANEFVPGKIITSLVNCFSGADIFTMDWAIFQEVEKLMPAYSFYSLGGQCRDGNANGSAEVAYAIRKARFVWHTKNGGDGYGHILHNAYACGRPVITRMSDYQRKLGGELLKPDETCIAIDGLSTQEIVNKIMFYDDFERYARISKAAHDIFVQKVNFDWEADRIAEMLETL